MLSGYCQNMNHSRQNVLIPFPPTHRGAVPKNECDCQTRNCRARRRLVKSIFQRMADPTTDEFQAARRSPNGTCGQKCDSVWSFGNRHNCPNLLVPECSSIVKFTRICR